MNNLNKNVLASICYYLSAKEISRLMICDKKLYQQIMNCEIIFKQIYKELYSNIHFYLPKELEEKKKFFSKKNTKKCDSG